LFSITAILNTYTVTKITRKKDRRGIYVTLYGPMHSPKKKISRMKR